MSNSFLIAGGCVGVTGVALGAFGVHGLSDHLSSAALSTWHTASMYHLLHAPVLVAIGLYFVFTRRRRRKLASRSAARSTDGPNAGTDLRLLRQTRAMRFAGITLVLGVLLFSGSLYLLALGGPRVLGPVTPLGGLALLVGWSALLYAGVVNTDD